jgi:hypothetical protein
MNATTPHYSARDGVASDRDCLLTDPRHRAAHAKMGTVCDVLFAAYPSLPLRARSGLLQIAATYAAMPTLSPLREDEDSVSVINARCSALRAATMPLQRELAALLTELSPLTTAASGRSNSPDGSNSSNSSDSSPDSPDSGGAVAALAALASTAAETTDGLRQFREPIYALRAMFCLTAYHDVLALRPEIILSEDQFRDRLPPIMLATILRRRKMLKMLAAYRNYLVAALHVVQPVRANYGFLITACAMFAGGSDVRLLRVHFMVCVAASAVAEINALEQGSAVFAKQGDDAHDDDDSGEDDSDEDDSDGDDTGGANAGSNGGFEVDASDDECDYEILFD